MSALQTETLHPKSHGLDTLPGAEVLSVLLEAQVGAVEAVRASLPALERAAELMAECLGKGGRICYAGAGSSALMANADGLELPGTFGIAPGRIGLAMAGGIPTAPPMSGDVEDDVAAGEQIGQGFGKGDLVIAVSASGSTPFALGLAQAAKARGARIVAIANNAPAPLFNIADVCVHLPTPPEVIAGSTRMGAGTAQKVALNLMSTLMGIRLGQVHDGMMVGLVADNDKLRARARAMVAEIAGVSASSAAQALSAAHGAVKPAVLVGLGATAAKAAAILDDTNGNLRAAMTRLRTTGGQTAGN